MFNTCHAEQRRRCGLSPFVARAVEDADMWGGRMINACNGKGAGLGLG